MVIKGRLESRETDVATIMGGGAYPRLHAHVAEVDQREEVTFNILDPWVSYVTPDDQCDAGRSPSHYRGPKHVFWVM